MENPWTNIGGQGIHPFDQGYAAQHNKALPRSKAKQAIRSYLPPLPYIGDLRKARVILLGKNPSIGDIDETEADRIPALFDENYKSLSFASDFPFFYLDPRFEGTNGHNWWLKVLKDLLLVGRDRDVEATTALSRIACAQYHPYRSEESFIPKEEFPTQQYTFELVREAARNPKRLFILLNGVENERLWRKAVPDLPRDCIRLKSAQSAALTAGNMLPADWERLTRTVCEPDATA